MTPEQLKDLRTKRGMSQKELANKLGKSVHAVRSWEQGKNPIPHLVEKALLSEVQIATPIDLVNDIQAYALEARCSFQEATYAILRAGIRASKGQLPK